ncbi:ABC transporter permease [Enterococcus faecalis]|uniref:ABC transporter permease n=1 Tax=Enterococcus faecalis TaxID=1351 RepID=UPI0004501088|nr:ABC transporter permease [Enterococcus faecalis]ETU65114.1 hypothetical protein P026_00250 [Enterococcus faecalis EnGen0426]
MKKKKYNKISLIIFIATLVFLFLGFIFAPNDPRKVDMQNQFAAPNSQYPFGTDDMGRCIFSRVLEGGYVTIGITILSALLVSLFGTLIGLLIVRNKDRGSFFIDSLLNAVTAIPPITYLIIFIGIWGNSIPTMIIALTASLILRMIKLVKSLAEVELSKAYIMCAISSGANRFRILFWHILPNIKSDILHFLCVSSAEMIMSISGFSFIGLTLGEDVIDWGSMISSARTYMTTNPGLIYYPVFFVFLSTLAFTQIGRSIKREEQYD